MTPDEPPSEANQGKGDGGVCSNAAVEVNCNGLAAASTPQIDSNTEAQESERSAEAAVEQQQQQEEDQQNANQADSSSESKGAPSVDTQHQNCNGSAQDGHPQAPPTAVSPDSVTVEIKEGEAAEAEAADEQMLYGGDAKREDKEKGNHDN